MLQPQFLQLVMWLKLVFISFLLHYYILYILFPQQTL